MTSVWIEVPASAAGWFRIADNVSDDLAQDIAEELDVPVRVAPSGATGAELARILYPKLYEEDGR